MILNALRISFQVTAVATLAITLFGLALAMLLARHQFRGKLLLETLITLPLVLPPSVLGYYLLISLGQRNPLLQHLRLDILFTWQAAALAATLVGLPLMVQAARSALAEVSPEMENAARLEGASEWQTWRYVTLPMARGGIWAGIVLGAARALGEFGATLMVAGNIPGRTQTLPMAIFDAVQNRQYNEANLMVLIMTSLAFFGLWLAYRLGHGRAIAPAPRRQSLPALPRWWPASWGASLPTWRPASQQTRFSDTLLPAPAEATPLR
ncbi:MAG: molybdate ABC transporter permease subunit [Chloroflexi bacterium]|nr:molybdate ABC transporter permease subunit [Chloroflexota bacterium]